MWIPAGSSESPDNEALRALRKCPLKSLALQCGNEKFDWARLILTPPKFKFKSKSDYLHESDTELPEECLSVKALF